MSDDGFSWAPFGPSPADDQEPLPPLAPLDADEPVAPVAPVPSLPPPVVELEPLPFEEPPEPPPAFVPSAPAVGDGWSDPPPIAPTKKPRSRARPKTDAGQALVWGILGLTLCPILIPSIVAIKMGMAARRNKRSDQGAAQAAIIIGWVGVAIWALAILAVVAAA